MKIGYVHPNPFPSVVANIIQIVQMCRAFALLGHRVTLFVPRAKEFSTEEEALAKARDLFGDPLPFEIVFVPRVTVLGRMEVLGSVRGTLRALREHSVDFVYTRNVWSVSSLSKAGTPFIFESHDAHLHETSKLLGWILKRRIIRASKQATFLKLVAISEALKNVWKECGVPADKLLAAHDAVDLEMFETGLGKEEARRRLELPADKPIVTYTGALKDDRGVDLILEAALQLPGFYFCIIGGTQREADRYRGMAVRLGARNVKLTGRVPHRKIPEWLAAADVLLLMWTWQVSTIRICSPMKLFEYMAAGRHIVGPAFPTVCEVLEDGKDAILFEPDNVKAMVEALRKAQSLLNDPTLPLAARRKVAAGYTWTARCRRILDSLPKSFI